MFGRLGLGYGSLGGQKPEDVEAEIGRENVIHEPEYGHCTWWDKANFDKTMQAITGR